MAALMEQQPEAQSRANGGLLDALAWVAPAVGGAVLGYASFYFSQAGYLRFDAAGVHPADADLWG